MTCFCGTVADGFLLSQKRPPRGFWVLTHVAIRDPQFARQGECVLESWLQQHLQRLQALVVRGFEHRNLICKQRFSASRCCSEPTHWKAVPLSKTFDRKMDFLCGWPLYLPTLAHPVSRGQCARASMADTRDRRKNDALPGQKGEDCRLLSWLS